MKQSNTSKYAYAAGIIDGEGCIRIYRNYHKNQKGKSIAHLLEVAFGQNEGKIIDWFMGNFGGSIQIHSDKRQEKEMWYWKLHSKKAGLFLKKILPFLKRKKKEAEIGLRLFDRMGKSILENKTDDGRFARLSEKEIEIREEIMKELSEQKHKLIPPQSLKNALVETKQEDAKNSDAIVQFYRKL